MVFARLGNRFPRLQLIWADGGYAAGHILFPKKFFREALPEVSQIDFKNIKSISKSFGNSIKSTLWRTVETLDVPCFGFICEDPRLALPPYIPQSEPSHSTFLLLPPFCGTFFPYFRRDCLELSHKTLYTGEMEYT